MENEMMKHGGICSNHRENLGSSHGRNTKEQPPSISKANDMKNQSKLNKALQDAIEAGNLAKSEELLKLGADPLGFVDEAYSDELLLTDVFLYMAEDEDLAERFPDFLWLFCKYGIDIAATAFPEFEDHSVPPLWDLALCRTEAGMKVLHALLEYGLNPHSAEVLIDRILEDMAMCDGCEIEDEEFMQPATYGLKMTMLIASYPSILKKSTYIQEVIELEKNRVQNLIAFRNWNDFDYHIDLSTCTNIPHGLRDATLTIRNRKSGELVWTMCI